MDRITLDSALVGKLRQAISSIDVCDEDGNVIGFFTPRIDSSEYENIELDISDEELQRRINSKEPRYTTAQVLRHLESL